MSLLNDKEDLDRIKSFVQNKVNEAIFGVGGGGEGGGGDEGDDMFDGTPNPRGMFYV